eukprot:m.280506 g.280506  ORF g.280506 m.280506 type:complete len:56 (+) comp40634_c0_seq78:304-471(+)
MIISTGQKMSNSTLCLDVKRFAVKLTFILLTVDVGELLTMKTNDCTCLAGTSLLR